jgi:hypothetical protein
MTPGGVGRDFGAGFSANIRYVTLMVNINQYVFTYRFIRMNPFRASYVVRTKSHVRRRAQMCEGVSLPFRLSRAEQSRRSIGRGEGRQAPTLDGIPGNLRLEVHYGFAGVKVSRQRDMIMDRQPMAVGFPVAFGKAHPHVELVAAF